ncbi:RNA chaperone Hfq [uncultured Paenibacillus sp.]|uniref:RNA chaperone Hfq n=1 Tax=uncultured Paenibacillus sp. TaxID=227322 RepID=UPI0028055383|nr:RNA chaperone Hfq [uncultured Paenibacillus sp.]
MKEKEEHLTMSQDFLLNALRKNKTECTIITTNGVRIKGVIELFDSYVILTRSESRTLNMVYKHAVSTIVADQLFR